MLQCCARDREYNSHHNHVRVQQGYCGHSLTSWTLGWVPSRKRQHSQFSKAPPNTGLSVKHKLSSAPWSAVVPAALWCSGSADSGSCDGGWWR